jgi:hypothetical protein
MVVESHHLLLDRLLIPQPHTRFSPLAGTRWGVLGDAM